VRQSAAPARGALHTEFVDPGPGQTRAGLHGMKPCCRNCAHSLRLTAGLDETHGTHQALI
jgi:hypothetical protein